MLSSSELSAALTHNEPVARDHALFSLAAAGARSGVMADVALSAIDLLGADAFANPLSIRDLPATQLTVTRLMASYARRPNPQVGEWIADLPQSLLAGIDVSQLPAGSLRTAIEHRLELGKADPVALWRDLASDRSPAAIHALVHHEQFLDEHLPPVLNVPGHPLELPAIELAGRIHFATVLRQLLDRFTTPEPIGSAAVLAVARMGTAGAVTEIEQRCDRGPSAFRLRAAQCLARFRVPSAEATLHRLLMEEDQPEIICALARSLATICTTTSLDRLLELVRSGKCRDPYDKHLLAGLSLLLKKPIPEVSQWAGIRAAKDRAFAESLRQTPTQTGGTIPSTHLEAPADQPRQLTRPAPIRATDKVGRNDPCPCGSGKKYKKCCGA